MMTVGRQSEVSGGSQLDGIKLAMLGDRNCMTSSEVGDDERVVCRDGAVEVRVDDLVRSRCQDLPQLKLRS